MVPLWGCLMDIWINIVYVYKNILFIYKFIYTRKTNVTIYMAHVFPIIVL